MKKFKEVQRFTQWWIWLILFGFASFVAFVFYRQYNRDEMFGDYPYSTLGISLLGILIIALILFFSFLRMKTKINKEGIFLDYFPLARFQYGWDQIEAATIVKYDSIQYGIRKHTEYGTTYNTKDQYGLFVILTNGDKFCIGTDHPEEIQETIDYYFAK